MHYKDGTLAQIGDVVVGTVYNNKGTIVGIISEITSQTSETCNCKVQILTIVREEEGRRLVMQSNVTDYSECKALLKVC